LTSKAQRRSYATRYALQATLLTGSPTKRLSLAGLTQDLLEPVADRTSHPTRRGRQLHHLTGRHHLTPRLRIARRPRSAPHTFLTDSEHTDQLRRCLHDDGIPIEFRAAGSLALLFGLR